MKITPKFNALIGQSKKFLGHSKKLSAAVISAILVSSIGLTYAQLNPTLQKNTLTASHASTGPVSAQPNVVLILTDDQTYDSIKYMPYVNGRSDWVRFNNAFMPTSLCCPGRSTLLSGQYSHTTGVFKNDDAPNFRDSDTIATWLKTAGYRTGMIGKYLNLYPWTKGATYIPPGWDYWSVWTDSNDDGTDGYYNYSLMGRDDLTGGAVTSEYHGYLPTDYSTDVYTAKALDFINNNPSNKPFFLYLASHAPHDPPTPSPAHAGAYKNLTITHSPNFNEADVSDKPPYIQAKGTIGSSKIAKVDKDTRANYETLLSIDDQVKSVFDALQAKNQLDNTVVMLMTDNGFSHYSHRWSNKRCEYDECIRTPLLIHYPGTAGTSVTQMTSAIDIAPTIAEIAGAHPTITEDGTSLVPFLTGQQPASWRTSVLLEWKGDTVQPTPFYGIRTDSYKYVEIYDRKKLGNKSYVTFKELYNLQTDSYELNNVAGQAAYASIQTTLASQLYQLEAQSGAAATH